MAGLTLERRALYRIGGRSLIRDLEETFTASASHKERELVQNCSRSYAVCISNKLYYIVINYLTKLQQNYSKYACIHFIVYYYFYLT